MIDNDLMRRVCAILGEESISEADLEARVLSLADSPIHARRLIDWTREAFGLVLIGHIAKVVMPKTFRAEAANGEWMEFSFDAEPIFRAAVLEASEMIHAGPRGLFQNIATCGGLFAAVNNALNEGADIGGAELSGPSLLGIPAEVYLS